MITWFESMIFKLNMHIAGVFNDFDAIKSIVNSEEIND